MISLELMTRYSAIRETCLHHITGHRPMTMADQLAAIGEQAKQFTGPDVYGTGELIESFEVEVAEMLGKEAAVFLPSGTMAQCIALRIWADRASSSQIAFHGTSHLQIHEQNAYHELYGLEAELIGDPRRVVSLADLQALEREPAAVLLELPMREIGGQLPSWEELDGQSQWARQQGIALHMDGARLWQCPPHYGRSLTEITALFDSVYVSFYKDIGGIAGSVLAGSVDFIDQAKMLIRRAGGNLYSLFPYVLAARAGMQRNLATLPDAVADAAWLAERFNDIQGLKTRPHLPPTNLFHLYMKGDPQSLITRACQWSEQHKVFLLPVPRAIADDYSVIEFSVGQALRLAPRDQWQHWLDSFFAESP
jgi:threonine aldolase